MLSGLGLNSEAHKALVTGTHTYPQSHSLWLLRLKCEVGDGGDVRGDGGDVRVDSGDVRGEKGEDVEGKEGSDPAQLLSKLEPLCSEAIDKVPKEVSMYISAQLVSHPLCFPPAFSESLAVLVGAAHTPSLPSLSSRGGLPGSSSTSLAILLSRTLSFNNRMPSGALQQLLKRH